jgi:hypothetical protein
MLWLTPGHIAAAGWPGWAPRKADPERAKKEDVKLVAQDKKRGLPLSGCHWVVLHDDFTCEQ